MITTKARILKIALGFFYCLPSGLFLFTIVQNVKYTSQLVVDEPSPALDKGQKEFLYLVQAEGCLPNHLLHPDQLGLGDNRDVIVLSWKTECKTNSSHLSHVKYIFRRNTTWGTGRNLLYYLASARRNNYLYYNFLDEDVEFKFTEGIPKEHIYNKSTSSPLHAFENYLRAHEPAIGLTNFCSVCGKKLPNNSYVSDLCCSPRPKSNFPAIFPVSISFDAGFNAFHRNAIGHLLPYNLEYERKSWWESQKYIILAADLYFRGQVLRYLPVTVINTKHRSYPKAYLENWKRILLKLKQRAPQEIRSLEVFTQDPIPDMDFHISDNVLFTPRWNITIPKPKAPIIPFRHFEVIKYDTTVL